MRSIYAVEGPRAGIASIGSSRNSLSAVEGSAKPVVQIPVKVHLGTSGQGVLRLRSPIPDGTGTLRSE